jgi:hypothetical protein
LDCVTTIHENKTSTNRLRKTKDNFKLTKDESGQEHNENVNSTFPCRDCFPWSVS